MKPASLHRRILFPLLLCGGLLFALLFWYFPRSFPLVRTAGFPRMWRNGSTPR